VVVDAEVTGTNKTTRKSEGNRVLEKQEKGTKNQKKDLTGPTLLEISGNLCRFKWPMQHHPVH
jgi:hypothetical protein